MIKRILPLIGIALLALVPAFQPPGNDYSKNEWQALFDMELSHWDAFIGVPEPGVEVPGYTAENRQNNVPLGLNNDPLQVFRTEKENGQVVVHVSGQILGGLTSKKQYQNYRLKFKFKWGEAKYAPRLNAKRDNGILYHCTGPHGKFWNVWMRSQEMQIQEGDMGDYFALAGTMMNIRSVKDERNQSIYSPSGELKAFVQGQPGGNRCRRSEDFEKPHGEWNELELICFEDKSLHIVNGHVVMALQDSRIQIAEGDEPSLQKGYIQVQSEYAEAYYTDMQIQNISELPKEYAKYF